MLDKVHSPDSAAVLHGKLEQVLHPLPPSVSGSVQEDQAPVHFKIYPGM